MSPSFANWSKTLNPAQTAAVNRIRDEHNSYAHAASGSDGWTVYLMPSLSTPVYLELRHYLTEGGVARWVIERDGSVSAHNDRGRLRHVVAVAEMSA